MQLLVAPASDTHPALEVASWIVTIVAFGLVMLQLIFYWFGRKAPLQVRATGYTTTADGQSLLMLYVEFRSRTRDTQTVRELVLFEPPNSLSRALRPWWYEKEIKVVPPPLPLSLSLPLSIDGHDTADVRVAFNPADVREAFERGEYTSGSRIRLKVRASRRRPHVARIRMKAEPEGQGEPNVPAEALPPQLAANEVTRVPVVPATDTSSSDAGTKIGEPDSDTTETHRLRVSARTLVSRIGHIGRRGAPAAAAFIVLMASGVLARFILRHQRSLGMRQQCPAGKAAIVADLRAFDEHRTAGGG